MVNDNTKRGSMKRRKILKGLVVGTGTTTGSVSTVSARSSSEIIGTSYDTLTGKQGPDVSGNIIARNSELRGTLNIAGFALPLKKLEKDSVGNSGRVTFSTTFAEKEFQKEGFPLKVTIDKNDGYYSGILSRSSGKFGHLGFVVGNKSKMDIDGVRDQNMTRKRWERANYSFNIPDKGLPTDSGLQRLKKVLRNTDKNNSNSGGI